MVFHWKFQLFFTTLLLGAHFQKTNFAIAMAFSTWILKQITNKNNVTVFIFFNYYKSYKPKSRTIFLCAQLNAQMSLKIIIVVSCTKHLRLTPMWGLYSIFNHAHLRLVKNYFSSIPNGFLFIWKMRNFWIPEMLH